MVTIGMKLREVSDNSIWTITRIVNSKRIEIQKQNKKGNIVKQVINYDNYSFGNYKFSKDITQFTVKCFVTREVYANSKEDAISYASKQIHEDQNWNDTEFDFDFEVI